MPDVGETDTSLQTLMNKYRGARDEDAALNTMPQWNPPGMPRMPKAKRTPWQRPAPDRLIDG